jgi:Tol biopolymer transport system component
MQIYRMNPDGSAVTRLTTTNYYESHPSCGAAD